MTAKQQEKGLENSQQKTFPKEKNENPAPRGRGKKWEAMNSNVLKIRKGLNGKFRIRYVARLGTVLGDWGKILIKTVCLSRKKGKRGKGGVGKNKVEKTDSARPKEVKSIGKGGRGPWQSLERGIKRKPRGRKGKGGGGTGGASDYLELK